MPDRPQSKLFLVYFALLIVLGAGRVMAAPGPDEIGDVAPHGEPDGMVDETDVELMLRAIAGDIEIEEDFVERADAGPVTPIDPPDIVPQRVRPNPNPEGPLDIGDAVIIARRAAGLIIFDQVNEPPLLTIEGEAIVSDPDYLVSGRVVDDSPVEGGTIELDVEGTVTTGIAIVPDGPGSLSGSFSIYVVLAEPATEISARARDAEGRRGPADSVFVLLDQEPPLLTISSPPDWFITRQPEIEFSGTAFDESGVAVEVNGVEAMQLPPDLWGATLPLPAENENTVIVIARDGAVPPNEIAETRTVIRDTVPPLITLDPLPEAVGSSNFALSGEVSDAWGIDTVLVNGEIADLTWDPATSTGRWTALVPVFEGENDYEVEAVDLAGNRAVVGPIVLIGDFVYPEITLISPAHVSSSPTDITLGFSEIIYFEHFGSQVFSPALRIEEGTYTLTGTQLVEGPNQFEARVSDLAGNTTVEVFTITLDTVPPLLEITRVSNAAFLWDPEDGLDGVVTNAPTATVEGTVSDAVGVASVTVNGYTATVNEAAETFIAVGIPLLPRANTIVALAADLAGNTSSDSVSIHRDAEGPVVALDFARAAYVSTVTPPPPPFDGSPLPSRYYLGTTDIVVSGTAADPFYTGRVESLSVLLDGVALPVTGSPPFSTFSFTLPAASLASPGLHLLEVESFDAMNNRTLDVQAMLAGQWFMPGSTILNAVGLAVGAEGLAAIAPLLEQQVEAMDHDIPDETMSAGTATITIYGMAFCRPSTNPVYPPYDCQNDVNLELSLTAEGRISIRIQIPTLYAGIRTDDWCVGSARNGYMVGTNVVVSLLADFVNTPEGVGLEEVPGSASVTIGDLNIRTNVWCTDALLWMLGPWLEGIVAGQFEDQISSLLETVNDMLAAPIMSDANTEMELWIAYASNDAEAIRMWLDARGNPCPGPLSYTSISDGAGGTLPCPPDSPRLAPGSFAGTPNLDGTSLPLLDLVAPDGDPVSAQAAANDEFANYMLHEQWAMGALDMTIDQAFLGDGAPITLDTDALALFIPDLRRSDVAARIPVGSEVAIEVSMPLPPVVSARQEVTPVYDLAVGEMNWRVLASADGDPATGYETLLFNAAVSVRAPAGLTIDPATHDDEDDLLTMNLGTPSVHTDITENPLIINEGSLRSMISTLINLALPMLAGSFTDIALPANTVRFLDIHVDGASDDFLVLSGHLVQTITLVQPAPDETLSVDPVVISGTVEGLQSSTAATVELWLPGDTSGRPVTITSRPNANRLTFSTDLAFGSLPMGESTLRLVSTDGLGGRKASMTFVLNRQATEVSRPGGEGCFGCDASSGAGGILATLLGLILFFCFFGPRRRRRLAPRTPSLVTFAGALVLAGLTGCEGCGGCGATPAEEWLDFTGPAVSEDAVFVISELRIGEEYEGFDVNPDNPGPDNALSMLGPLANDSVAEAIEDGGILLLMQFPGLTNLPAAGESGNLDAVIYLGVDLDDDPTNNFSGHEIFGIDPASYGPDDEPLIVFEDLLIRADSSGRVTMEGGPSTFTLSIPMQGSTLELTISPTYIYAELAISSLRSDGIEATDGLLGGVIPASALAEPIEGIGFAPIDLLVYELDVDLNGDGEIDRRPTAENEDGLSAGIVFAGVPAYLSDVPINKPPVVTLEPLPRPVNDPWIEVSGTLRDPDGDCMAGTVLLTVNGENEMDVPIEEADDHCTFTGQVRLFVGQNTIRAAATDEEGGTGRAEVTTRLDDINSPVIVLLGPTGAVTRAEQIVTGIATDDIGIDAVQIDINGELFVVSGSEISPDGSFDAPVMLPGLGSNTITAVARDLGGNLSEPSVLEVFFEDAEEPSIVLTAAESARERVEGEGPWEMTAAQVLVSGVVDDNAGISGLTVTWSLGSGEGGPVEINEDGEFEIALLLPRGSHTLSVRAVDEAGNVGLRDGALEVVDRRPPAVTVEAPDAVTHLPVQELVVRLVDDWDRPEDMSASAGVRGGALSPLAFDSATETFRAPIILELGGNPVIIEALDTSGNLATVQGVIELVDEEAPHLEVFTPENESWTIDTTSLVTGVATDNIGLPLVTVEVGSFGMSIPAGVDGSFSLEAPLQMGQNLITIMAVDGAGLIAQETRRVERRDPEAVAAVSLTADPDLVAIGNGTSVVLRAEVTRLAGGPIADGTTVGFAAGPGGLGELSSTLAITEGGIAEVVFTPGLVAGIVSFGAEAESVEDGATLAILWPSALAVDVCLAEDVSAAGFSFELDVADEAGFTATSPSTDSALGIEDAEDFFAYNSAVVPTTVLIAGTEEVTGGAGSSPFARLTWPLDSGFALPGEIVLRDAMISDLLGEASDAGSALSVCRIEHLVGVLPPRVTLSPIASPTAVADHIVTGTVEAADLSGCQGELFHNGQPTPIDVTSGGFSHSITLVEGANQIRVVVTDDEGRQGLDEIQVRYAPPNHPPLLAITSPGAAVTTATVDVEGTVSDPDDGLVGMLVTVQVGSTTPTAAAIDMDTGTFSASVTLQPGANLIRVTATDARGASTIVSQTTSVIDPINPPIVTITEPTEGQIFTTAQASLAGRVDEGGNPAQIAVTMTLNGTPAPISYSPFSREFTSTLTLEPAANVIEVTATDITDQSATATRSVTYNAPNTPPRVTIASPVNGAKLFIRDVTVTGTLRDNRPLDEIQSMTVNGVAASLDVGTGNWSATVTLAKGTNTITAEAEDGGGLSGSATITVDIFDPVVVVNSLQIGGPDDGFDVDSNPPHPLSDAEPDNALSALGAIANDPLQDQIEGTNGDPLLFLFEFDGLVSLPAAGQSITVDIFGYLGIDPDGDPTNNFTGDAAFEIDPASFDPDTGDPIFHIENATITNSFGVLKIDTFPHNPARFEVSVDSTDPPLVLVVDPAYLATTITLGPKGLLLDPGLLGGVVPAATLATPISMGDTEIVPLELLISDDPSNPVPDVDLNGSGYVNTWDATASNPDGVSVGLVFTAVPASIVP